MIRKVIRKLMMLDPGYRKAFFLEQKLSQVHQELLSAIAAAKPADRIDELKAMLQNQMSAMSDSLVVSRFLEQYDAASCVATKCDDHFISYTYPTWFASGAGTNIGDWIQTVATERAIRKVVGDNVHFQDVRRDLLVPHHGGTCIMQGWYEHGTLNFMPNVTTHAVWIGTHFSEFIRRQLTALWRINPSSIPQEIGCRDISTLQFCQDCAIESYFSRCLTLTLDIQAQRPAGGKVFCVDCPDWLIAALPPTVRKDVEIVSQRMYHPRQNEDMKATALNFLMRYANEAKLVVTTALHCAQPCIAMGVPVVFISPGCEEDGRFTAVKGLLKVYTREDLENGRVDFNPSVIDLSVLKALLLENLSLSINQSFANREYLRQLRNKIAEFTVCHV